MSKIDKLTALTEDEEIIWQDKKRYFGLPISFTTYSFSNSKLYLKTGLLNVDREEILLYRVLDISVKQSFGQKIFNVGTIVLNTADKTTPILDIKNVKDSYRVSKAISTLVEQRRDEKRVTGKEMFGAAGAFSSSDGDINGDGHFDLDDMIDKH